jgi:hypothetical protein
MGVGAMISLLSIQDVRGHGLPGTPVSRVRERLRRGSVAEGRVDTALARDLDRLSHRLEKLRARGGAFAQVRLAPELEALVDSTRPTPREVRPRHAERKRA